MLIILKYKSCLSSIFTMGQQKAHHYRSYWTPTQSLQMIFYFLFIKIKCILRNNSMQLCACLKEINCSQCTTCILKKSNSYGKKYVWFMLPDRPIFFSADSSTFFSLLFPVFDLREKELMFVPRNENN